MRSTPSLHRVGGNHEVCSDLRVPDHPEPSWFPLGRQYMVKVMDCISHVTWGQVPVVSLRKKIPSLPPPTCRLTGSGCSDLPLPWIAVSSWTCWKCQLGWPLAGSLFTRALLPALEESAAVPSGTVKSCWREWGVLSVGCLLNPAATPPRCFLPPQLLGQCP